MIVFNTTYHVEDSAHDEVMKYLKEEFIPKAVASNLVREPRLFFIHPQHEEKGRSYSLQFRVNDQETLEKWLFEEGDRLQTALSARFGQRACGFMTILEEIQL